MSTALIPVVPGRPATVVSHGAIVYLSLHDAYHLHERKAWKRRFTATHPDTAPDRHQGQAGFRAKRAAYKAWLTRERSWYHGLGLEPPVPIPGEPEPVKAASAICAVCERPFQPRPATKRRAQTVTCGQPCGAKRTAQRRQR